VQTLGFALGAPWFLDLARRRYGDVVRFGTLFDREFVMVFDPESVERVFKAPPDRLRAGEANAPLSMLLGERSVLVLDGAEHIRHRKLMLPPFHGRSLRAHESTMREAADRSIDSWPVGEPFELIQEMYELTLNVVSAAVFGIEEGPRRDELKRRIRAALEPVGLPLLMLVRFLARGEMRDDDAARRFAARKLEMDEAIHAEIARRRAEAGGDANGRGDDALSLLLAARDEDGRALTDEELRDELVTLLVAGHETTAAGAAWTLELVLRHPEVLERARRAVDDGDTAYLDAVVKESLRIRPVVPGIGRVVRGEPFELGGYEIPPGREINPSIRVLHRRADVYPSPRSFRPERFLEDGAPDTYSWIPFGGGTRRCLGAGFALLEMRTVLARVLERTELRRVRRRPERIRRRGVTMVPRGGVRVVQVRPPRPASAREPAVAELAA
jgi:cytochrome P450